MGIIIVGFLTTAIVGATIYIITDNMLIGLLIGSICGIACGFITFHMIIAYYTICEKISDLKTKKATRKNTWTFPLTAFYSMYLSFVGPVPHETDSEYVYQKAFLVAKYLLNWYGVAEEYHDRYTSREAISGYFAEIAQNRSRYSSIGPYEMTNKELTAFVNNHPHVRVEDLIGREKTFFNIEQAIIGYRNELAALESNYSKSVEQANFLYDTGKQSESSWAIHGGIANAIAGPAAGVAVAMDIERQNIAAREHNEALKTAVYSNVVAQFTQKEEKEKQIKDRLKWAIRDRHRAEALLTQSCDEVKLLKQLKLTVDAFENMDDNTVKLTLKAHGRPRLRIFEGIPATADGSFTINLFVDERKVGSCLCMLNNLSCTCKVTQKSEHYQYSLQPYHLWLKEKK